MISLNSKQRLAAEHMEGPMLVLAGAGSGKTRIVTYRIAHLIELGVPSSKILALTFTNKAADEMRRRIENMCNQAVLTSTFHALGARILRESITLLGYPSHFNIYDEKDKEQLLKNCLTTFDHKQQKGLVKSLSIAISQAKNELLWPHNLEGGASVSHGPSVKEVYALYQEELKKCHALDFDDLLFLTVHLFNTFPQALEMYQKRWSYILIDEYQDTNAAQYQIANLLSKIHRNLFVVGDPDQSIYSWRGAQIDNILGFEKDYVGAKVVTLEQNYRSTSNILKGANALIAHNEKRYEKKLWSDLGVGEKIGVYVGENEKTEAEFVLETVLKKTRDKRLELQECVIFYRTNAQSRVFEDACLKRRVPYVIVGGLSFYQRREIKDILALLRMVVSDFDFLSFVRTINLPKRGIGQATLSKWRHLSKELELPILTFCRRLIDESLPLYAPLNSKQREGLKNYLEVVDCLKAMCVKKIPIEVIIKEAIERCCYLDILKADPDTVDERKENLEALINKAVEWSQEAERPTLVPFLEELLLKSSLDEASNAHSLHLMTLHHGKGLEFELTFIVGMEEDLFPHINSKYSPDKLEEERRLCYVGMTRAKQCLYLTASTHHFIWGSPKVMRPSRFLKEIPPDYVRVLSDEELVEEKEQVTVGMIIFHEDFGKGLVKKGYHTSLGMTYDVLFFKDNVIRSLVSKYSKFKSLPPKYTKKT